MVGFDGFSLLTDGRVEVARTRCVRNTGRHTERAAYMAWVLLLIVGCSGTNGRQSIDGTVTFDGTPLENGQITLIPEPGTLGPTAGAEIENGKFVIPASGGTFAGKFRVDISASRPSGEKVADRFTGKPVDAYEQFIPAKYNTQSQLEADVKVGTTNHLEFALNSK